MDFSWTDEQRDFRDSTINFAKRELNSKVLQRDKAAEFDQSIWKKCADFGIQGFPMPDEYGGCQQDEPGNHSITFCHETCWNVVRRYPACDSFGP